MKTEQAESLCFKMKKKIQVTNLSADDSVYNPKIVTFLQHSKINPPDHFCKSQLYRRRSPLITHLKLITTPNRTDNFVIPHTLKPIL